MRAISRRPSRRNHDHPDQGSKQSETDEPRNPRRVHTATTWYEALKLRLLVRPPPGSDESALLGPARELVREES